MFGRFRNVQVYKIGVGVYKIGAGVYKIGVGTYNIGVEKQGVQHSMLHEQLPAPYLVVRGQQSSKIIYLFFKTFIFALEKGSASKAKVQLS